MIEIMPEANKAPKRSKRMVFLVVFFVIVLAVLVYSSFFSEISITGDLINENKTGISINADFNSVPNLSIDGEFSRISIRGLTGTFLYIGNQKFPMNDSSRIFLTDYDGEISFTSDMITELKGKVSHVSINGLPILPGSDKELKINIKEPLQYSFLDVSEGVLIRKINYITSGKIIFGEKKSVFNIREDNVLIEDFFGGINVDNGELSLDGTFEKLETKGNHEISVSV